MSQITIYDPHTGAILLAGFISEGTLQHYLGAGMQYIAGEYDPNRYRIDSGGPVERVVQPVPVNYQLARRDAYPFLGEFADAYYWRERGDPSKMQAYLSKIDSIKAKFPKPAA